MKNCLNCHRSEHAVPLLGLTFQEQPIFICPQCLPALIHKPHLLAGKLPGMQIADAQEPNE